MAVILLAGAIAIRFVHLDQSLLSFHPTRQYRSALIARACYYDRTPGISSQAREVAIANRALQPAAEPPVMEWLACATYQLLGRESLSFPRVYAACFWMFGALPLYLLAARLTSAASGTVALSLYLFLPYGIEASRAFQPDPLMTCAALWAAVALARHAQRATPGRMAVASTAIALAALVKPMSVFITVAAGVAFAFRHHVESSKRASTRGLRKHGPLLAPVCLGLLPAAAYYGFDAIFGTLARDQMRLRFVPSLLDSPLFWSGLVTQIRRVFGLPVFACAVLGTLVAGMARPLLVAWWIGYAAFAVAFTYHVPTHDYYHLPFIALAALALAALMERLNAPAMLAFFVAAAIAIWGVYAAWPRLQPGALAARVRQYEEIGALTGHTTHAVFLDADYGYPLMYHGEVSGDAWPGRDDLAAEALDGAETVDAGTRLARDYDYGPTHFIVTDMASLDAQPDLGALLAARATLVRQTPAYAVYEFTR